MQKRPTGPYRLEYAPIGLPAEFPIGGTHVYRQTDAPITRLHVHDSLEVGYCYDGRGIFVIEDKVFPFSAGDVCVVNSSEMHLARSAEGTDSHWTFLQLDPARLVGLQAPERELLRIEPLGGPGFPNVLKPSQHSGLAEVVRGIITELNERKNGYRAAVRALVWTLMVRLHRIAQENPSAAPPQRREAIERVAPALEHLAAHYDQPIYVEQLAGLCHTSVTNLRRWLRAATGVSPARYLTQLRMQMAATLLTSTTRSVLDISLAVGCPTLSSFNRHFRRHLGLSPREWRRGEKGSLPLKKGEIKRGSPPLHLHRRTSKTSPPFDYNGSPEQ